MTAGARELVECVPNFSEGRDLEIVDAIAAVVAGMPGVLLLGRESDLDHNRSVLTFVGPPEAVREAAVQAVEVAAQRIDLTRHVGVHPRIGAADVVPFVPLAGVTMDDCVRLAHRAGAEIWERARVPVYFYEFASVSPVGRPLEDVRRGGFAGLLEQSVRDEARAPDLGGPRLHPTAGASAVGARRILVACNANLETADLGIAKRIARTIRASSGGFPYVKALGLELPTKGQVQVSMNLTHFEETPLATVFRAIERQAADAGVRIAETEIIGFVPQKALQGAERFVDLCVDFNPSKILETRIAEISALR